MQSKMYFYIIYNRFRNIVINSKI